jgi:hypothetical protein
MLKVPASPLLIPMNAAQRFPPPMHSEREKQQRKERIVYVKLWAEYVRTHPASDWSKLQADLINAELAIKQRIVSMMTKEQYFELKGQK